jgi:hypothetical protein
MNFTHLFLSVLLVYLWDKGNPHRSTFQVLDIILSILIWLFISIKGTSQPLADSIVTVQPAALPTSASILE